MNTAEKQEIYFKWKDTPEEERRPKFRSVLLRGLKVDRSKANKWDDDRAKIEYIQVQKTLEKPNNPEEGDYDSDEWLRNSTPEADKALVEAVKRGSPGAQKIFYQLIDRLREKAEKPTKGEISASERIRIAREIYNEIRSGENQGDDTLPSQLPPLPEQIRQS